MDRKIDLSLFREKFIGEARERISRMNGYLVYLEKNPGDTRLESDLLREAHTLKGAAKMMGFAKISDLSHRFEEALAGVKERKVPLYRDLIDAMFRVLDALSRLVESLGQSQREAIDVNDVLERLRLVQIPTEDPVAASVSLEVAVPSPPPVPAAPPPVPDVFAAQGADAGRGIRVDPERLERLATLLTGVVGRQLRQVELRERIGELGREYRRAAADLVSFIESAIAQGTVSSDFAAGVAPLLEAGRKAFRGVGTRLGDLHRREDEESTALSQGLEDLRSEMLAIRMVPLSPLFESLHRSVRDLSGQLGKEVELLVRGGKTEIDRKVAEALMDPLVHLIRNAVDHGIESPEVRAEKKKPEQGKIIITATPKKGRVVIEVEDDGKGIDLQEIREAAVRKGLITEKAAYRLDDRELLALIFRPGFTTARTVTDISGRGIGMDIVRAAAEKFNGTVEMFSMPGKGAKVVLELPFTMAVSRVLLFLVGTQHFGIPVMHAEGVIRFTEGDVAVVEGRRTLRLDGTPVPVVWLSRFFDMPSRAFHAGGHLAVLVRHSQRRIALVVDLVEGEFEVVVKDLGAYVGKVPLFMGSTILGTGEIALLLDVYDLVSAIRLRPEASMPTGAKPPGEPVDVLVVEPSLLSREMQQRVLAAAGLRVEAARDGDAALDLLSRKAFDLVVASAAAAGSDGAGLLPRLRGTGGSGDIPVILVTPAADGDLRERALAAGARECIGKDDFCAEKLLPLIERLLEEGRVPR